MQVLSQKPYEHVTQGAIDLPEAGKASVQIGPRRLSYGGRDTLHPSRAGDRPARGVDAAIKPFRHLIVYPQMMRQIERARRAGVGEPTQCSS
jgi:hypothetical protein